MYLTKDEFLQKFGILPQEFEEADISWEELLEIADDYERRRPTLEKIRKEFVAERTGDLLLARQALSQLSYIPVYLLRSRRACIL